MSAISVVMITDNKYVMPTTVAITSIIENKEKSTNILFSIICDKLELDNHKTIESMANNLDDVKINCVDIDSSLFEGLEKSYSNVSRAAMLKFKIPELVLNVDKVLYIDGDVIVTGDLTELFHIELDDYFAAVIKDGPKTKIDDAKKHAFYGKDTYFNSGVMLLNLKKMREENTSEALMHYRLYEYNYFMDQDAFNVVFGDDVRHISVKYDFLLHLISYRNENYSLKQIEDFYTLEEHYDSIDDLINEVVIFHYTFDKPWKYYDVPMNELWMHYFKKSPYADTVLDRSSFMAKMYKSRTYSFSRKISKIALSIIKIFKRK